MAKKSITTDIVPRSHTRIPAASGDEPLHRSTVATPRHGPAQWHTRRPRETALPFRRGSTSPNIRARLVFRPLLGATLQQIWSVWKSISSRDDDDDDVVMQQWPPFALFWSGRVGSKLSELSVGRGPTTTMVCHTMDLRTVNSHSQTSSRTRTWHKYQSAQGFWESREREQKHNHSSVTSVEL